MQDLVNFNSDLHTIADKPKQRNADHVRFKDIIAPMDEATFFAQVWEQKVALFDKNMPNFLRGLFTLEDVDQILSKYQLKASECRLAKHETTILLNEYAVSGGIKRGVAREDLVDKDKMFTLYREGATIILEGVQFFSEKLAAACRCLEKDIGYRVHANVYITPAKSQGFPIHFDTHDLLIFQIHGHKRWKFYGSPIQLPVKEQYTTCSSLKTPLAAEMIMEQGDVLYLPRGVQHEALTNEEMSIHIALGIYPLLWSEILTDFIRHMSLKDDRFRKAGPRFLSNSATTASALHEGLDLLESTMKGIVSEQFLQQIQSQIISEHRNIADGFLANIEASKNLHSKSSLMVREDIVFNLRTDGDYLFLSFHKNCIRIPVAAGNTIRYMIQKGTFSVSELSEFNSSLALCERLMKEGFLKLSPSIS